jgi:hypothetical protein
MELVEVNDGITLSYIKTFSTSKSTGLLKFLMIAPRTLLTIAVDYSLGQQLAKSGSRAIINTVQALLRHWQLSTMHMIFDLHPKTRIVI